MIQAEWAVFATVALAHALAVASPGPDFAMVVRQSLAFGRGAGVWTAAGIGSGILFHVAYGLFGLNWLTQRYPQSLTVLGVAGAFVGYLIFTELLGIGDEDKFVLGGLVGAVIGAMILLFIYERTLGARPATAAAPVTRGDREARRDDRQRRR